MARLSLVDRKQMSPQYAQLVERVKSADGYVNFLSMMAHRQEVVEPCGEPMSICSREALSSHRSRSWCVSKLPI